MTAQACPIGTSDLTAGAVKMDAARPAGDEEQEGREEDCEREPGGDAELEGLGCGDFVGEDLGGGIRDLHEGAAHAVKADPFGASRGADFEAGCGPAIGFDKIDDGDFSMIFAAPLEAEDMGALHDLNAVASFDWLELELESDRQGDQAGDEEGQGKDEAGPGALSEGEAPG